MTAYSEKQRRPPRVHSKRPKRPTHLTPRGEKLFLHALTQGHTVAFAALQAGVSRQTLYVLRKRNKRFAKAWELAWQSGTDMYIEECRRRGLQGFEEPLMFRGKQVGSVRRFSDNLLMFVTKARDPSFRDSFRGDGPGEERLEIILKYADKPPFYGHPTAVTL